MGLETSDDAGVFRISDDMALVLTADFITPPVDDPFLFGQIAAANALSDVYAMGGTPMTCLNLVGFPGDDLPLETLGGIISGALSKITEAGAVLAGGHTTEDEEPKFGLSVTGCVHPDKIWRNSSAKAGDKLILTKPLGSGVLFNANLKNLVSAQALNDCVSTLIELNKTAAEVLSKFTVNACTDITGFGFAGHTYEMAKGAELTMRLDLEALPLMDEALAMYKKGVSTGVNATNREMVQPHLRFERELPTWRQEIVFDPQTSGGLMASLPPEEAEAAVKALHEAGVLAATVVGEVLPKEQVYLSFH